MEFIAPSIPTAALKPREFLELPQEIRAKIYTFLVGHRSARLLVTWYDLEVLLNKPRSSQILAVCRMIFDGANPILYANTNFKVPMGEIPIRHPSVCRSKEHGAYWVYEHAPRLLLHASDSGMATEDFEVQDYQPCMVWQHDESSKAFQGRPYQMH